MNKVKAGKTFWEVVGDSDGFKEAKVISDLFGMFIRMGAFAGLAVWLVLSPPQLQGFQNSGPFFVSAGILSGLMAFLLWWAVFFILMELAWYHRSGHRAPGEGLSIFKVFLLLIAQMALTAAIILFAIFGAS